MYCLFSSVFISDRSICSCVDCCNCNSDSFAHHYLYCCCCAEHSDAEAVRYHESRSKMNADIGVLEDCVRDYVEQLKVERAKSKQLELMVSFQLFRIFVVAFFGFSCTHCRRWVYMSFYL